MKDKDRRDEKAVTKPGSVERQPPPETLPGRASRRLDKATNKRHPNKPATDDYMPENTAPKTF